MKTVILFVVGFFIFQALNAQQPNAEEIPIISVDKVKQSIADKSCKCIDSLVVEGSYVEGYKEKMSECIKKNVSFYQISEKLAESLPDSGNSNITLNMNEKSKDFQKYYKELQDILLTSCPNLKLILGENEYRSVKSISDNPKAREYYDEGLPYLMEENYEKALPYFKKAVKEDKKFAYAWDNLGLCYRKTGELDKAIDAYKKSLEVDANGQMPIQNLAVTYEYKKDFSSALFYYEKIDKLNPERYYGMGRMYTILKEYEKAADAMSKAFNLYTDDESPYRVDAEKVLVEIYQFMKAEGKEARFFEILKENNINVDDE